MKKIAFVLIFALAVPSFAYAVGSFIPFGGKVTVTNVPPNVICPFSPIIGNPFYEMPVGASSPGPWSRGYGLVNVGFLLPSAWILGKYRPVICTQYDGVEAHPYPTMQTDFYGTSFRKPVPLPGL